jgi:sorbitol-specific phosphotransferase system component IIA
MEREVIMTNFLEAHNKGRVRKGQAYVFGGEMYTVAAVGRNGLYSFEDMNGHMTTLRLHTPEGEFVGKLMQRRAA